MISSNTDISVYYSEEEDSIKLAGYPINEGLSDNNNEKEYRTVSYTNKISRRELEEV